MLNEPEILPETRKLITSLFLRLNCDSARILERRGNKPEKKPKSYEALERALNSIKPVYGGEEKFNPKKYGTTYPYVDYNILYATLITGSDFVRVDMEQEDLIRICSNYPIDEIVKEYGFVCAGISQGCGDYGEIDSDALSLNFVPL